MCKIIHDWYLYSSTCDETDLLPARVLGVSIINMPVHNSDVRMGAIASQITSLIIVYSTLYSGADQRNHQSSASLAFVRGIHRRPVNSLHKWPVAPKMFPFDDVIMDVLAASPNRSCPGTDWSLGRCLPWRRLWQNLSTRKNNQTQRDTELSCHKLSTSRVKLQYIQNNDI